MGDIKRFAGRSCLPADPELRARLAALAPGSDLELVVLYGSHAKGCQHARSDVDVGIATDGAAELDAWYARLAPVFGDPLDLVDLGRISPLLAFEIARSGRVLYEREPGRFRRFQVLAALRYGDTAKLRAAHRRAIHRFLEKAGLE